MNSWQQNIIHN